MDEEERPFRVSWTSNDEIAEMLDVTTAACSLCGRAARVPEDVVAVKQQGGQRIPVVICVRCQPEYARRFREMLDQLRKEEE